MRNVTQRREEAVSMGFGWEDAAWVDPPEGAYGGTCAECAAFEPCPCGCGWGACGRIGGEMVEGTDDGCEEGAYR